MDEFNIDGLEDVFEAFTPDPKQATEEQPKQNTELTTDVELDEDVAKQENVGSEGDNQEEIEPNSSGSSSPNTFSSIATALKDEGVLSNLEDTDFDKIKDATSLIEAINKQVYNSLDKQQQRINDALNSNVEPSEIQKYETTIKYLEDVSSNIEDNTNDGEELRRKLIYQDYINKGFSKERSQRETDKSFTAGTDIEDAKESLASNKEYFTNTYNEIIKKAKEEEIKEVTEGKEFAEKLRKSIMEDSEIMPGISLNDSTKKKVIENLSKPTFKDKDGTWYTPLQSYELNNREDFIKKLGVIFTLTDGFKSLDNLVSSSVKKETKKSIKELENVINNTSRSSDGSLNLMNGVGDAESSIGFDLDI